MEVTGVMFELSHPERMNILHILKNQKLRMSDIAKQLGITTAETSRHLDRLGNAKLLSKNSSNLYHLTPLASIMLKSVGIIEFFTKNQEFFLRHDISSMPEQLLCMEAIKHSEIKQGTLENVSLISDLTYQAKDHICIISDVPMSSIVEATKKRAEEGVKFRIIYLKGVDVPEAYDDLENIEVRFIEKVDVVIKYSESAGGFALPNLEGKIDFSEVFFGENDYFLTWLEKVFEYYWKLSKSS